jgi:hypothetical protein
MHPVKIPADFLAGIGKLILKFLGNFKGPRIATVLKKS